MSKRNRIRKRLRYRVRNEPWHMIDMMGYWEIRPLSEILSDECDNPNHKVSGVAWKVVGA